MIEAVIKAAQEAGRIIEAVRAEGFETEEKGEQGPVTRADRGSDAYLHEALLGIESCGWLSEEAADDGSRLERDRLWVVDPLDGTKEFVQGIPQYSVSVGLVDSGEAVLGVIHNPSTGDTFWATRGGGAFRNGTPIHVGEASTILASNSEMRRGEFELFEADWELQSMGSIALKLALVACGESGITLSRGPKWEWDVCAGQIIIEEAAGLCTDVFGGRLGYNKPFPKVKGVLAGAPEAHARAAVVVASVGASDRMSEFPDAPIEGA